MDGGVRRPNRTGFDGQSKAWKKSQDEAGFHSIFAASPRASRSEANLDPQCVFVASGTALDLVLRIVAIAVLARLLVPEYFGLVAMVTALTAIVDGFRDLGLAAATVQRQQISARQISNLFWINLLAGGLFAAAFCAMAPVVAAYYRDPRLLGITLAMSTTFLLSGLSVQHEALMSRQLRQGELAFVRLFANLASVLLAIVLAIIGLEYWALVAREVARSALIAIAVWIRCPWIPNAPTRGAGTRTMLRYGADLSFTHVLTAVIANCDRILIGRYFGPVPLGLYRQAQQLLLVPIDSLNQPIVGVSQPTLSRLQDNPDRYRRYYERILFLVALLTVPLGLFVAIYAEPLTLLLLGPNWSDAAIFLRIFGFVAAIRPAIATSAMVLITCGKSRAYLVTAVVHSLVLLVLMLIGVRWGAEGIAGAHVAATIILMYPKLLYSFIDTPVSVGVFLGAVRTPVVAAVGMTLCLLALRNATGALRIAGRAFARYARINK